MGLHQIKAELCSAWGADRDVANQAWASTYDQERLASKPDDEVRRIAANVVTHAHDTPKERIWMDWYVTCPIFVERQFDKYRMSVQYQDIQVEYLTAPFGREGITQNELSGRYRTIPERPYTLPPDVLEIMVKADNSRTDRLDSTPANQGDMQEVWRDLLEIQHKAYKSALSGLREAEKSGSITNAEYKRAREVLRGVLGTAYLTDMRLVFNGNAFEWIVQQRITEHAQLESRVLAYRLLTGALQNQVASTMVKTMIEHHGWQKQIDEIEAILKGEGSNV